MNPKLVAIFVVLCVVLAQATSPEKTHHRNKDHKHRKDKCTYKSSQGFEYDLRMLETALRQIDWKIVNPASSSTFHLNPCGSVKVPGCPKGSSICEIDAKKQAVSFGSYWKANWADGSNGDTFEITYGGGELCNNGQERKAVVSFRCALPSRPGPFKTHVASIEEDKCLVRIEVESPHACPVSVFCNAIKDAEVCGKTEDLCFWRAGKCVTIDQSWLRSWAAKHNIPMSLFLVGIGVASFVTSCSVALLCCACCRVLRRKACKRMCKKSTLPITMKAKKIKKCKTTKTEEEKQPATDLPVVPDAEAIPMVELTQPYVYQPLQQLQDVYALPPQGYGFHMVQFVPSQHVQFQPAEQQ